MVKKILIFLLIISLNGCGYTPIFKFNENVDFKVTEINFEGDRLVNTFLKSRLRRYISIESNNEFEMNIESFFEKKEISKNTKGEVDIYKIRVKAIISIEKVNNKNLENFEGFSKTFSFSEEFLQKSITDKFEEKNYENSIVQNLTDTIFDKFILSMANK